MDNESWQAVVNSLVDAKRCVANAWHILDGVDGAADGVDEAVNAALAAIDAVYALEVADAYNQDVAAPADVQAFWEKHRALPGFAVGT